MKRVFKMVNLTVASAVMSLALVGQSFAASATDFTDLNNVAAKDKIIALQQGGIVSGVTPHSFAPLATLTEAQSIQLIVSALGLNLDAVRFQKPPKATDYFANADDNAWYATSLITAAVHNLDLPKGLVPDQDVTREEFTHQLIDAMETVGRLPMINLVPVEVKDADQMTVDYSGSIQRALHYGIVSLNAYGKLNPKQAISREQAAEELFNAVQYLKSHDPALSSEAIVTYEEGVKLIADTLSLAGTDIKIKIDPTAKMTRESFVSLLVQTLKTSGKLPMIKIAPVEIKDLDQVDSLNTGYVQLAVSLGIATLSEDGLFNPGGDLSHSDADNMVAQTAVVVQKFVNGN